MRDAMSIDQVVPDGVVGAASQAFEESGQPARVIVMDDGPRIDSMGDFMAEPHRLRQTVHGMRRSAIAPCPGQMNVRQANRLLQE